MRHLLFGRYSAPFIALGGILALACLVSTWYINRLQSDLARAVRHDVTRLEAAEELQICFRQIRLHSLVASAAPTEARRKTVEDDRQQLEAALAKAHRESESEGDLQLLETIEQGYREYDAGLTADPLPAEKVLTAEDLIRWSDTPLIRGLLVPCRELADRQRNQMARSLEQSETQTTWAGRVLLGLGLIGTWWTPGPGTRPPVD